MKAAFSKAKIESEIASRFGDAFKLHEKTPAEVISTGIPAVDDLSGGLPRGAITEVFGPASSGRTSFMLSTLAYATSHEEVCAVIDTSGFFDPLSAANASVALGQLLWIRCDAKIEHAFKAADLVLQSGGFGLIFLDLGDVAGKDARRIISSWWYRFRRAVENTPTTFVVIAEEACVRSCASLSLKMKKEGELWSAVSTSSSLLQQNLSPAPFKYPFSNPTHSNLLSGMQLRVERQKPVQLTAREIQFEARISH